VEAGRFSFNTNQANGSYTTRGKSVASGNKSSARSATTAKVLDPDPRERIYQSTCRRDCRRGASPGLRAIVFRVELSIPHN